MRDYLKEKTFIRFPGGECYEILGMIGEGGSGLIYSAGKVVRQGENYVKENSLRFALKECYPISRQFNFLRMQSGEIVPENESEAAANYLRCVASMQLNEGQMTSEIYDSEAIRLIPIQRIASSVEISFDKGQHFHYVNNAFTVMASMENKGESIASWYQKNGRYTMEMIFRVIQETLFAVREVHLAGYLHLDLQEGNIFVTGQPTDESLTCFLLDFGSARKRLADGLCAPVGDQPIFSSEGYRAPEIVGIMTGETPDFRLGPEADLYSIGYLLLYLLTGRRYSTRMLEDVRKSYDGHYLTRKNIQDMKCPPHVEEIIQHILEKALETDSKKRYHTAEEMLKDVSAALNALRPYHSQIAGMKYDAYILYRSDNILHKHVAVTLQKLLEHFRTPGLKRIQRVFLDETELSADYQADKQVMDALKASRYLIIIGQNSSGDDIWQSKEVKFFLKTHKPSDVLTILAVQNPKQLEISESSKAAEASNVSGTSEVAGIAAVLEYAVVKVGGRDRNFPLAADIRGASEKEILKKLKKDGFLRIAAPILSVPYDGLVQRYRKYKLRKRITMAAVCLSVAAVFTVYALYQSYQIALQETIARRNKAQNLCVQAMDQYDRGDKAAAIDSALQMNAEAGDTENYVIPEQLYTLNTALDSFESGYRMHYSPLQKVSGDFSQVAFSKNGGEYSYAINQEGELEVFSAKEEKMIWTLDTAAIQSFVDETIETEDGIQFVEALDTHRAIVVIGKDSVVKDVHAYALVIDADSRSIISGFPLEEPIISYRTAAVSCNERYLVYEASKLKLYVYDIEKGSQVECILAETGNKEYQFTDVSICEDGSKIAIGTEKRLIVYDIESKQLQTIANVPIGKVVWTDNSHVACMSYQIQQEYFASSDPWSREKRQYAIEVYDITNQGNAETENEKTTADAVMTDLAFDTDTMGLKVIHRNVTDENGNTETKTALLGWMRSNLYFIDAETGKAEDVLAFQSDIVSIQSRTDSEDSIFVALYDGKVMQVTTGETIGKRKAYEVDNELDGFSYTSDKKLMMYTEEGIVLCGLSKDGEMVQHSFSSDSSDDRFVDATGSMEEMRLSSGEAYRLMWLNDTSREEGTIVRHAVEVYPLHSDELLLHYECEDGNTIKMVRLTENDTGTFLCVLELANDRNDETTGKIKVLSLDEESKQFSYALDGQEGVDASGWLWMTDIMPVQDLCHAMTLNRDGQLYWVDFEKGTVEPLSFNENECEKILSMSMSPDGRKILLLGVKKDYLQLLSYDVQNQQIDADTTWQSEPTSNPENAFLAENSDGSQVAVYDGNAECYLIETAHLKQKQVVDIENAKNLQLSFFENDQFLLGADSACIWLYDLDKHQVVSSYAVSMRNHAMQLTADISGSYFTLKEIWVTENIRQDEGMSKQNCHIYFVDESHQIYPYADVAFGYRLPDEEMVYQFNSDGYAEHPLYTFADLYKKAQKE